MREDQVEQLTTSWSTAYFITKEICPSQFDTILKRTFATFYYALYSFIETKQATQEDIYFFYERSMQTFLHMCSSDKDTDDIAWPGFICIFCMPMFLALCRFKTSLREAYRNPNMFIACNKQLGAHSDSISKASEVTIKGLLAAESGGDLEWLLEGDKEFVELVKRQLDSLDASVFQSQEWQQMEDAIGDVVKTSVSV
jgi:hypothetical protein